MQQRRIDHGVTDSTNERALEALERGEARQGDVHVASAQTRGRGSRGRSWLDAPGESLLFSVVHFASPPAPPMPALTMATGLAVRDAVRALGLERAALKWPNDVVVRGAKLCGILVETRGFDPLRPAFVIGVGLNVRQRAFPPELVALARPTSLALESVDVSLDEALDAVLANLAARLEQAERSTDALAREYLRAAGLEGARVTVRSGKGEVQGALVALEFSTGLTVRTDAGALSTTPIEHVRELTRD